MITPVKSYSVNFIADGLSNSVAIDCSLTPVNEDFRGNAPQAVLLPVVSSVFTGVFTGVTAALVGHVVTLTFGTIPPKLDGSGNLVVYSGTFLLQYGT